MSFKWSIGVLELLSVYIYLLEIYLYIPCVSNIMKNKKKTGNSKAWAADTILKTVTLDDVVPSREKGEWLRIWAEE